MKNKIFILILLIFCFPICFFACKEKKNYVLSKPFTIGYVINENETTGKAQILLVTDKNPNTSKYEFSISDSKTEEKTYVTYYSTENYLDVTDIFTDQKQYYYFVRYIGAGKYTTSKPSEIKVFQNNATKVTTPSLQITGTTLNWFKISYATGYEIYETVKNQDDTIKVEEKKIATVDNRTFSYDISSRLNNDSPYYKYSYTVQAISSGYYTNSNKSNSMQYLNRVVLDIPRNIQVNKNSENKFILSFNAVDYATKYKVIVNASNDTSFEISENSCDVTSFITNYASYYFQVQAVESNALDYQKSNVSSAYEYKNQYTLNVSNLTCSRDGEKIIIGFNGDILASNKYTLTISQNGQVKYTDGTFDLGAGATREILISNLDIVNGEITISVKANAVSDYILENSPVTINFNIV